MRIRKTEVDIAGIDQTAGVVRGSVTFDFDVPEEDQSGTAHYQCTARLADTASHRAALEALVREAYRQTSRMPEHLIGARKLSFAAGVWSGGA